MEPGHVDATSRATPITRSTVPWDDIPSSSTTALRTRWKILVLNGAMTYRKQNHPECNHYDKDGEHRDGIMDLTVYHECQTYMVDVRPTW